MQTPPVAEGDSDLRIPPLARLDVVFVPGDPPRAGRFALVGAGGTDLPDGALRELLPDGGAEHVDGIELLVPVGGRPRRKLVAAAILTPGEALGVLLDAPSDARPSAAAWSAVLAAGLTLVARGRLLPAVTPSGFDAWRVSPLDPASARLADELAAALPWIGHAVPFSSRGPLRICSPLASVRAAWDAVADALVRTEAAALATGATLFARHEPGEAEHLRAWLVEAEGGLDDGASVALRVELGAHEANEPRAGDDANTAVPIGRAVVQLSSRADPSLVVDAAEFFGAPAVVISRFGDRAETELLLALRRGVRAWPRLEPLLRRRIPTALDLDEDALDDLLSEAAPALASAGIEVLWPADLVTDGLALRAGSSERLNQWLAGGSLLRRCWSSAGSSRWVARPSTRRRSPSSPRPSGASFASGAASSRPIPSSSPARRPAGPSGCRPPRRSARSSPRNSSSTARSWRCEPAVHSPGSPNGSRPSPPEGGRAWPHRPASRVGSAPTSDAVWHGCTRCARSV